MQRSLVFAPPLRPPERITVAIPVRNGGATLAQQLTALAEQTCSIDWELVVVDNGSTDDTADVALGFAERISSLRVVREPRPGIGPARNAALREATGEALALCDADDIVQPGWIEALVQGLPGVDMVGGFCDATLASSSRAVTWRGTLPPDRLPLGLDLLPFAPGGNSAVWVGSAREVGGWNESYRAGSDDVDFSWRLMARGGTLAFARDAVIAYQYREGVRDLLRQAYRFGRTEVRVAKEHPQAGGQSVGAVRLAATWWGVVRLSPRLLMRDERRVQHLKEIVYRLGRLRGSVEQRFLFP